jgi:hypothetical protein
MWSRLPRVIFFKMVRKQNDYIILETFIAMIRLSICSCLYVKLSTCSSNLTKDTFLNFNNQDLDL